MPIRKPYLLCCPNERLVLTAKQGMASPPSLRLSVHFHVYRCPNTARRITASSVHGAVVVSHTIAPIRCALRLN